MSDTDDSANDDICMKPPCIGLRHTVVAQTQLINFLNSRIDDLNRELTETNRPVPRAHTRSWHYHFLIGEMCYAKVWKLSQMEENMSASIQVSHPNIVFVEAPLAVPFGLNLGGFQNHQRASHAPSLGNLLQQNALPLPVSDIGAVSPIRLNDLPPDCLARIFEMVLFKEKKLVHCISRLDPHNPPRREDMPPADDAPSKECSIANCLRPSDELSLLLVCRRFYWIGVHCFYGLNTFAFSSLGEFGRFCRGIKCRLHRVCHIEMMWHGSQYLTNKPSFEIRNRRMIKVYRSKRTEVLDFLLRMRRLRTLVVHLDESSAWRKRRGHEPWEVIDYHESRSRGYPQYRLLRKLHTIQGLDNILWLRDMQSVRIYDCKAHSESLDAGIDQRIPSWDWSFRRDIASQVTQPKDAHRRREADLRHLDPLGDYVPTADDWAIVSRWFTDPPGVFPDGQSEHDLVDVQTPSVGLSDNDSSSSGPDTDSDSPQPPGGGGPGGDSDSDSDHSGSDGTKASSAIVIADSDADDSSPGDTDWDTASLGLSSEGEGEENINQPHESDDADDDMDEDSEEDSDDDEQDDDDFHGIEQRGLPEFDAKSEASDGPGIAMDIDEYEPDCERRDEWRDSREREASEESESMFIPNDTPSRASSEAIIDLTGDEPSLPDDNQAKRSESLSPDWKDEEEDGGEKRAQTYPPLMDIDEEMMVVDVGRFVSEPWC